MYRNPFEAYLPDHVFFCRFNVDKTNQKGRPLCSLQLNSFMFAAVNSEVCIRR